MQKTFIVIVALFGLISANSFFRAPTTELYAPKSRNFTIPASDNGAYRAFVDFAKDSTGKNHTLLVSLYTSQQVLNKDGDATKCLTMVGDYDCAALTEQCKAVDQAKTLPIQTPYFNGQGLQIAPTLYAEYFSWATTKDTTTTALQTTTCETNAKVNTAMFKDVEGIWGLGFDGAAKSHFVNSTKNFVISFDKDHALNVQFSDKAEWVPSGLVEKRWSVKTDGNWRVNGAKGITFQDIKDETAAVKVMFDVNTKTTGLPKAIYDKVVAAVAKLAKCTIEATVNELPGCDATIKASALGNLTIVVDDKSSLVLTAHDLIADAVIGTDEYKNFKLNIKALSKDLTGANYVTDAADAERTIIIGSKALTGYATVFNVEESSVTQYWVNLEAIAKAIVSFIKWIIIAIVGSIIVCCLCVCFCCGGTAWIVAKLGKKDKQDNYYQSSQTDPFVARK